MDLHKLSKTDPAELRRVLEEWQEHPATQGLRDWLVKITAMSKEQIGAAYMSGNPVDEGQRIGLLRQEAIIEDLFGSSLGDLMVAFEGFDDE